MNDAIEHAHAAILGFLESAKEPCAFEPGHDPIPLCPGSYQVTHQRGRLLLEAWSRETNLVRRITGVEEQAPGRVTVLIERFGKRAGTLHFVDKAHRKSEKTTRRAGRLVFREWFRRTLLRQFPGWRLREVSSDADLEHSLSPAYSRGFITKGATGWAAIGAPPGSDSDGILTFGLIWLDYLRRREPRVVVEGLALFVPENHERTTCLRVRHLDANQAAFSVFVYADGVEQRVDIADAGNLDTRIGVRESGFDLPGWTEPLLSIPGVERIDLSREHVSWRVRGLEFARWNGAEVRFGIDSRHPAGASNLQEIEAIARELSHFRSPDSANSSNPLYTRCPERWLESQIRGSLTTIDASLLEAPVYGQVPSFAATDRGVIDLLACGFDGRLAVVEVKASEDLHLPLQALDYWMRVKWHAAQNDFSRKGYFPGVSVGLQAPRMLLIAPALSFHPTTDTILRFFSPEIDVERIGVSMTWRKEMRIVLRTSRVSPSG